MGLFKIEITEQEAALHFVRAQIEQARETWPIIYQNIKNHHGEDFKIKDEESALFDLALAAIALDLQAVKNIFQEERASRIKTWVYKSIEFDDWELDVHNELNEYTKVYENAILTIESGGSPHTAIPGRLAHRWLGENIRKFEIEINEKKTGAISPLLIMDISITLSTFIGKWKKLSSKYKLTS